MKFTLMIVISGLFSCTSFFVAVNEEQVRIGETTIEHVYPVLVLDEAR